MADNFNLAKFLRNNQLLNEGIGGYKDVVPYAGAEKKLDGFGDEFDQVNPVEEGEDEQAYFDYKRSEEDDIDDPDADIVNDFVQGMRPYYEKDPSFIKRVIDAIRGKGFGADMYNKGFRMNEAEFQYDDDRDDVDPLPSLSPKFNISQDDFFDRMMGLAHEEFMGISDIVSMTIDSLRHDGFDDRDILNFLATDFSLDEEVSVSSSGVEMEEAMIRYDSDMQEDGKTYIVDLGFKSFVCVYDADNEQFIPEDPGMKPISKYNDRIKGVQLYKKGRSPYSDISYGNKD